VSVWRRKALALFPAHAAYVARPDATLGRVFLELMHDAAEAHARYAAEPEDGEAADALRRVHGFAEWCLHHHALWNAAGIGFYEDVFAVVPWEQLVPWLSPFVLEAVRQTWALGVRQEGWPKLARLVAARTDHAYRTNVFATGEIERL
jgi:hypothetical protein